MSKLAVFASTLLLSLPVFASQSVSPTERAMISNIEANTSRDVALLQRLVLQNSGTFNLAGVEAVADMLRPEFEALGFKVEWRPMQHVGRAGHLVATHRGNGKGQRILLIGHLDTVFESDSPFTGFTIEGNRAIGPGVGDDKGGVVVMLAALRAMHAAGALKQADIEVVLTGDEEEVALPLEISRADLIAAGKRADAALDFENISHQNGREMGAIARRSSNAWTLTVRGNGGHSSGIFSEYAGDGAAFEMARIISTFRTELPEPNLTFNVGVFGGGEQASLDASKSRLSANGKNNIIPNIAVAHGDFRTLSPEQTQRVIEKMQAIVARHLPKTSATIEIEEHYPPMAPTAGNRALLAKLNEVNRDLGWEAMGEIDPLSRGAGDIAFVATDVAGLIGLGASASGSHAEGESLDLDALPRQAKRAALLMHRLANTPRR